MDEKFIRDRITQLRLNKQVSEYQMSYDLGHSRGYINNISSGKALPSMAEFLSICEYFSITPSEFFDGQKENPELLAAAVRGLEKMCDEDVMLVLKIIERINSDCCEAQKDM